MGAEWGMDWLPDGRPRRLRELRRVVPIVQTMAIGGVVLTLFSLDDYEGGFAVRLRLLLEDGHPVAADERAEQAEFDWRRHEAARRGALDAFEAEGEAAFRAGEAWSLPYPELELEARDDRGRRYRQWGGERSWRSDLEGWEDPHYAPALDPAARELRLRVEEVQWLTARDWQGGEAVRVDRGPWAFVVPL
jgi:hypothetical protein